MEATSIKLFECKKDNRGWRLTALASDLGPWWRIGRLWPDACDEGILIRGKTGQVGRFVLTKTEKREGDTLCWYFIPADRKTRETGVYEVVIFNT